MNLQPAQPGAGRRAAAPDTRSSTKLRASAIAASAATTPGEIVGVVTSPFLGKYDFPNRGTAAFTFAGSVNASPDDWFIGVDVLRSPELDRSDR